MKTTNWRAPKNRRTQKHLLSQDEERFSEDGFKALAEEVAATRLTAQCEDVVLLGYFWVFDPGQTPNEDERGSETSASKSLCHSSLQSSPHAPNKGLLVLFVQPPVDVDKLFLSKTLRQP